MCDSLTNSLDQLMLDLLQCQNVLKFTRHETGTIDTATLYNVSQVFAIYFPMLCLHAEYISYCAMSKPSTGVRIHILTLFDASFNVY